MTTTPRTISITMLISAIGSDVYNQLKARGALVILRQAPRGEVLLDSIPARFREYVFAHQQSL